MTFDGWRLFSDCSCETCVLRDRLMDISNIFQCQKRRSMVTFKLWRCSGLAVLNSNVGLVLKRV
jgi:hypothetical protein